MKTSGLAVIVILGAGALSGRAADATSPIDYTQRNTPYTPGASVAPQKQLPASSRAPQQDKRLEKPELEKSLAPVGDRRAGIDVSETREKSVREKDARRPDVVGHKASAYDHKTAPVSTGAHTTQPPLVAKYNDSMTAASATNMARFPAVERSTTAKINRFVFRKNPAESAAVTEGARVVPAAGGSPLPR
jgi:hypothetical protein